MKKRFSSLDGLRGLAAFGVFLTHVNIPFTSFLRIAPFSFVYKAFSDGPNFVQILFVLSGFLMAYLYPTVPSAFAFIQKRYTRIFPIVVTVVTFLWINNSKLLPNAWYVQIGLLTSVALLVRLFWKGLRKIDKKKKLGKVLFAVFFACQILFALSFIFIFSPLELGASRTFLFGLTTALANITLLTPFSEQFTLLRATFWSLAPEVLFYVLFPFLVIPLIRICARWGKFVSIIVIFASIKVLFDLDHALTPIGSMQTMNIARASGFVAGVTLGYIFRTKGKTWMLLEKVSKNTLYSVSLFLVLFLMQTFGQDVRLTKTIVFSNFFFLFSSIFLAFFIAASLTKGSLVQKVMSNKIMVFLGMISFSLYLIQIEAIAWTSQILPLKSLSSNPNLGAFLYILTGTFFVVTISFILFKVVEALYFSSQKDAVKTKQVLKNVTIHRNITVLTTSIAMAILCTLTVLAYTYSLPRTMLLDQHTIRQSFVPLLEAPATFQIKSDKSALGIISIDARYIGESDLAIYQKKETAVLIFDLFENGELIRTASQPAHLVRGHQQFQFGFPPILESKNKTYTARIRLEKGNTLDQVFLNNNTAVSMYVLNESKLKKVFLIGTNRINYILENPEALFAIAFFLSIAASSFYLEHSRKK